MASRFYILKGDFDLESGSSTIDASSNTVAKALRGEIGAYHRLQPDDRGRIRLRLLDHELSDTVVCPVECTVGISAEDAELLRGVSSSQRRFEVFTSGGLSQALALGRGSAVLVNPDNDGEEYEGVVRFRGGLVGLPGSWFGVELLVSAPQTSTCLYIWLFCLSACVPTCSLAA